METSLRLSVVTGGFVSVLTVLQEVFVEVSVLTELVLGVFVKVTRHGLDISSIRNPALQSTLQHADQSTSGYQ